MSIEIYSLMLLYTMAHKRKHDKDTESITASFQLPGSEDEWWDLVEKAKLKHENIHEFHPLLSGSKIARGQVLMFRTLHPYIRRTIDDDLEQYGLDKWMDEAEARLDASTEFTKYLNLVGTTNETEIVCEDHETWPGAFYPTLIFQQKCLKPKGNAAPPTPPPPRRSKRKRIADLFGFQTMETER